MSYSVATEQNAQLAEYESWDVVWFCHNNTFPDEDLSDPLRIHQHNYDFEDLADKAVEAGNVDGVCLHAIDQAGFRFFDSGKKLAPHLMDAQTFPRFSDDYKITAPTLTALGLAINHMYRFNKAMKARGLKCGFYLNLGQALNLYDALTYSSNSGSRSVWLEFLLKEIKWLTHMYEWDFVWLDMSHNALFSDAQNDQIYQALREENGLLVIRNCPGGFANFKFPGDVKHIETASEGDITEDFWDPETVVDETTYYIPSGIAYTGIYSVTDPGGVEAVMWQFRDYSGTAGLIENLVRDQSDFNTWYSYARTRNIPFWVNMPLRGGAVDPTYYSRVISSNLIAS